MPASMRDGARDLPSGCAEEVDMVRTGITLAIFGTLLLATLASGPLAAAQGEAPGVAPAMKPFDQATALAQLKTAIAGKEELPAVEVFKNIQQYKGVTAARFVRIMRIRVHSVAGCRLHPCATSPVSGSSTPR